MIDFICQLLEVSEVPKKLCDLIHVKSQGVPSWCEQLIKDAMYGNTIQIVSKATLKHATTAHAQNDVSAKTQEQGTKSRKNSAVNYEFLKRFVLMTLVITIKTGLC